MNIYNTRVFGGTSSIRPKVKVDWEQQKQNQFL